MPDKPNRNDPCHCGSEKKYKNCCQEKDEKNVSSKLGIAGIVAALLLGLVILAMALSGGNDSQNCPPGTVWSDSHQHCH
jgi:hypothetical protein